MSNYVLHCLMAWGALVRTLFNEILTAVSGGMQRDHSSPTDKCHVQRNTRLYACFSLLSVDVFLRVITSAAVVKKVHVIPRPPCAQRTTKSSKNTVRTGAFVGHAVRYLINSVPKPGPKLIGFHKIMVQTEVLVGRGSRWTRGGTHCSVFRTSGLAVVVACSRSTTDSKSEPTAPQPTERQWKTTMTRPAWGSTLPPLVSRHVRHMPLANLYHGVGGLEEEGNEAGA